MYSGSDDDSSSSNSSTPLDIDEHDDFVLNDSINEEEEVYSDDDDIDNDDDDGFVSSAESLSSSLNIPKSEPQTSVGDICNQINYDKGITSICSEVHEGNSDQPVSSSIPHKGSLRRILNPSSFHVGQNTTINTSHTQSTHAGTTSCWPMYAISVATENNNNSISEPYKYTEQNQNDNTTNEYQILFDRQQYEFCTRLFALLDTESRSYIGPECIQEFVSLRCPIVRRRDDAIFALRYNNDEDGDRKKVSLLSSPTFDEIWERTIYSANTQCTTDNNTEPCNNKRIGIEGWMVFCRLLSLAQHQESQRRFASRHLQQMCVHKHGGSSVSRINPNEIVVVVDNPPPGPPTMISIQSLIEIERERTTSHASESLQGWPFCPLPLPELDLVSTFSNKQQRREEIERGNVTIEPFSSSKEGDFILRFRSNNFTIVVRRSYLDFEWLNAILTLHKRPGQGPLCGRILPPFPSKQGGFHKQKSILSKGSMPSSRSASSQQDISEKAISVAKSGVGLITSMAKSVWSGYVGSSSSSSSSKKKSSQSSKKTSSLSPQSSSPHQEEGPAELAKRIERYLNYLLENAALSSSFPLNAILQASQSGLESTKQILQDHAKNKKRQRLPDTPRDGHSAASIFSTLITKSSNSISRLQSDDDTPWLRAAAQVAMALQFHGILETTGHESSSAKILHASLPKFRNQQSPGSWDEEETDKGHNDRKSTLHRQSSENDSPKSDTNFEVGVVNVDSELNDEQDLGGYDLLPSPGPSEEHRVLNAANSVLQPSKTRSRFVYGTTSSEQSSVETVDKNTAVLGSIRVDNDVDKLRDIIRSISHTLDKLHHSSVSIQSAQDRKNAFQLEILRSVDSWGDVGDEIISQRALVTGVAELESFNSVVEETNKAMTNDLLWQSSLASSAVDSVNEVRDAVRASHTATRAKSAAYVAAEKAKKTYESCDQSSSREKIQYTQSEASKAQSHAIHATVVEYEANIAKKRSAVSLAQDVKSWNVHRKEDILRSCIEFARSQQEASRKAVDAWESLREGLIESSTTFVPDVSLWTNPTPVTSKVDVGDTLYTNNISNSGCSSDWETGVEASKSMSSDVQGFASDDFSSSLKQSQQSDPEEVSADNVYCLKPPNIEEDYFSLHQSIVSGDDDREKEDDDSTSSKSSVNEDDGESKEFKRGDPMSTSMQSLIDGLMSWGEQENADDHQQTISSVDSQYSNLLG